MRLLSDYVLLLRQPPPAVTASGLHIPESSTGANRGTQAKVLAVGPGKRHPNTGVRLPMQVQLGDTVIITKHQNSTAEVAVEILSPELRAEWGVGDSDLLLMLRETEILAVVATVDESIAELEDVAGEQTADAEVSFRGAPQPAAVVDLMQALKDSLDASGYRRDEIAEERASRYTHEDGSAR